MTQTTQNHALSYLAGRPLTPASTLALRAVVALVKWEQHRRTRKQLQHLDDHLLDDIGLTRADVSREARRSFWKD